MPNQNNPEQAPEQSSGGQSAGHIQGIVHEPRYWLITLVLSAALSVIAGAGVYWHMRGQVDLVGATLSQRISELEAQVAEQSAVQNEPAYNLDNTDAADIEEISTVGWKTQIDSSLGFSYQYPSELEGELSVDILNGPWDGFMVVNAPGGTSYTFDAKTKTWESDNDSALAYAPKLANAPVEAYTYVIGDSISVFYFALIPYTDGTYVLRLSANSQDALDKVLPTFELLN